LRLVASSNARFEDSGFIKCKARSYWLHQMHGFRLVASSNARLEARGFIKCKA